jgi:hypothetical protein
MNLLESKTDLVSMRGMRDRIDSILPPILMIIISRYFYTLLEQLIHVFSMLSLSCVLLYDMITSILTIGDIKELQLVVHQQVPDAHFRFF